MSATLHPSARRIERAPPPSKTIVIVDDFPDLLDVTAMLLEEQGYRVLTAMDGEEGLRLALQNQADLVVLDYAMPHMTGGEVGRCLRKQDPEGAIKIVMNTATPEAHVRKEFSDYDRFLRKPLRPDDLIGAVAALLQD